MAASVIARTSSRQPAWPASISITSPWTRVESTSITTSRMPCRSSVAGCTATSTDCAAASSARMTRSRSGSTPETCISMAVTG